LNICIQLSNGRTSGELTDADAAAVYGIKDIAHATQLGWGIEGNLSFNIGKKGLFGDVGMLLTLPGIIGSIGEIQTYSSGYTVVEDSIAIYTLKIFAGLGLRIGKQMPVKFAASH
jgi:hypothetical protein